MPPCRSLIILLATTTSTKGAPPPFLDCRGPEFCLLTIRVVHIFGLANVFRNVCCCTVYYPVWLQFQTRIDGTDCAAEAIKSLLVMAL